MKAAAHMSSASVEASSISGDGPHRDAAATDLPGTFREATVELLQRPLPLRHPPPVT